VPGESSGGTGSELPEKTAAGFCTAGRSCEVPAGKYRIDPARIELVLDRRLAPADRAVVGDGGTSTPFPRTESGLEVEVVVNLFATANLTAPPSLLLWMKRWNTRCAIECRVRERWGTELKVAARWCLRW